MPTDSRTLTADGHTFTVDQMRLGDHAFAHYADDDLRWEIAAVFASQGLARGEKVVVMGDPAVSPERAFEHLTAHTGSHEDALASGQLVFTTMRELILPDRVFTAKRQLFRLREEKEQALDAGYTGLPAFIDMAWAHGTDPGIVAHRETNADELFADRQYAEICSYDRRVHSPEMVEAMRVSHPVALLERPGDLSAYQSDDGVHFIGDADLATGESFRAWLVATLTGSRGSLLIDLSRLCFLSAGCAGDLLKLIARAGPRDQVVVRCAAVHARTLRRLGAARIGWLVLAEIAGER